MTLTKPFADEGSWGPEYAQLHDDVLSGRTRQQYLVVEGIEGLADSLSLIAGMLYVAVLSGRALQIRENVPYSVAYDKPNIDWRYSDITPLLQHAHISPAEPCEASSALHVCSFVTFSARPTAKIVSNDLKAYYLQGNQQEQHFD